MRCQIFDGKSKNPSSGDFRRRTRPMDKIRRKKNSKLGFSLEHPQGVGIVGIVGTVGTIGIVGIEFCRPEPRPTTPNVLVDISSYSYLKEQKLRYT